MGNPVEINVLFFALEGRSYSTEVVFLNQNLAIRPAAIVRDFHADLLCTVPHGLFDFVDDPRNRLWPVKFNENALDGVGARARPTRASRARTAIEQILNRVSLVFG
jgi:hypothetical protein